MHPFPNVLAASGQGFGYSLDPTAAGATAVLSNGNLRATGQAPFSWYSARSLGGRALGRAYFEATVVAVNASGDVGIGIASVDDSMAGFWQGSNNAIIRSDDTAAFTQVDGGGSTPVGGSWAVGQVACIAVDVPNLLFWARANGGNWNNSGAANPATGVGGYAIGAPGLPLYAAVQLRNSLAVIDVNFGGSAFTYTPPVGFLFP